MDLNNESAIENLKRKKLQHNAACKTSRQKKKEKMEEDQAELSRMRDKVLQITARNNVLQDR